MAFFVGWAWVSWLRDLATLVARVSSIAGIPNLGELLCVACFGPLLSVVLMRGQQCGWRPLDEAGPLNTPPPPRPPSAARRPSEGQQSRSRRASGDEVERPFVEPRLSGPSQRHLEGLIERLGLDKTPTKAPP